MENLGLGWKVTLSDPSITRAIDLMHLNALEMTNDWATDYKAI